MHLTLSSDVEDELVGILTHACIGKYPDYRNVRQTITCFKDNMTSALSTVPYDQQQCESFLRLIKNLPTSDRSDGHRNCVLARLWSELDANYFVNLHGEDTPRLSRIQRLLPEPQISTTKLVTFVKRCIMLGCSERHEQTLNEMWVDKISYSSQWRKFMTDMTSEWKMQAALVRSFGASVVE